MLHLSFRDLKVGFAICNNLRGMYRCHACVRVPVITIKKNQHDENISYRVKKKLLTARVVMLHLSFLALKVGFAICSNVRGMCRYYACVRVPVIIIKKSQHDKDISYRIKKKLLTARVVMLHLSFLALKVGFTICSNV